MAETCSKSLIRSEDNIDTSYFQQSFKKDIEPGLVRTTCKAFSKGRDDKSGHFQNFNTYVQDFLKRNKFKNLPLERFRGNRFNILFRNAANVYFLKDHIRSYLDIDSSNRLLAAVKQILMLLNMLLAVKHWV